MAYPKPSPCAPSPHNTATTTILLLFIVILLLLSPQYTFSLSTTSSSIPNLTDRAPSWSDLQTKTLSTPTGARLSHEAHLRRTFGSGPPHVDATLRLFPNTTTPANKEEEEEEVRVTLYRDSAAWCPYCQKVWIVLEEKRIPYRVKTVPLNAYGDKPVWFTRLVDGGKLPAVELGGKLVTESMEIIKVLEETFKGYGSNMFLEEEKEKMEELLALEQEVQSKWFSLVFYPVEGDAFIKARKEFLTTLQKVNDALASTHGPWFLGGVDPSFVDVQYITHMERIAASVLYYKNIDIRSNSSNNNQFPHLDKWFRAFESRASYQATKSDYYTLIMSMPSQNGPGYGIKEAREVADRILGLDDAWTLPLFEASSSEEEKEEEKMKKEHKHEAAYALIQNYKSIVSFATRGASEVGRPSFQAELADPYAEPNEDYTASVDICLRHVTAALLDGTSSSAQSVASIDLKNKGGDGALRPNWGEYADQDNNKTYWWNEETGEAKYQSAPTCQLDSCLEYLRDRVGVPRDMSEGAAMQLRAHLNWVIGLLQSTN